MQWELEHVGPIECTLDECGLYTVIHRVELTETHKEHVDVRVCVRVDVMTDAGEPVRSFIGAANDVRKAVIQYIGDFLYPLNYQFSREHASYIGWEIHRAETTPNYVQD